MLQGYFDDSGSSPSQDRFVLAGGILPAEKCTNTESRPLEQRRTSGGKHVLPSCQLHGDAQPSDNWSLRRRNAEFDPTSGSPRILESVSCGVNAFFEYSA